ncbi:type II secretion system minor pseudopilin GspK [Pseudoduganella ginsengisoli]|uniref:Type II secretion system protein K n=1 Tax=Pseudoduganella ginsengisoli TaxID=1462440 RepID=A0A6L6Q100_9BURK|nr:type II secretion system minor pseudopilin GspK [Pseudoduganella ginsengisoli]MTW03533.1 general secretion pathway protein GspK [Pseudoduganella ginsengisoli]
MTARRKTVKSRARQRGVAIVTALLLTTLAVTIVASLFWQQQVQVRSIENQRLHLQTRWILRGALDWARLILQQDANDSRITAETSVWATALAETRLDDYVERERNDNEKYDATLSGRIQDAQSRYNLGNLARNRDINADQLKVFQRLLEGLRLNSTLAKGVAEEVARSQAPKIEVPQGGSSGPKQQSTALPMDGREPLPPQRVEDLLAVAGFSPDAVEKLRPFVIVLPPQQQDTKINVNMAPPELLAAMMDNFSVSEAANLVQYRKRTPFLDQNGFKSYIGSHSVKVDYDVRSDFFLVESHIRLGRAALDAEALIQRGKTANVVWIREN